MTELYPNKIRLLPRPLSDPGETAVIPVTSLFHETVKGHWEAVFFADTLSSLPGCTAVTAKQLLSPNGRLFLYLSRVGCRAMLTVSDNSGRSQNRSHYGSYTDWQLEITGLVGGQAPSLSVSLDLEPDEKTLSPYQKAGILGDITLIRVPSVFFEDFYVRSCCSEAGWSFQISCPLGGDPEKDSFSVFIQIMDPDGRVAASQSFSAEEVLSGPVSLLIPNACLWYPDSPRLYRVTLSLLLNGHTIEKCVKMAGLCSIQKQNQQVLLNNVPLKLRGLAYREPLADEGFDPAEDLKLFREANINYLRSLYYPFSEKLLDLCDTFGILTEQSAPVDGVGQILPANQNAPALRPLFLGQYAEMLLRDRSHPSILLWSLGNESVWGDAFRHELALTRTMSSDRLANFHLPMTIPQDDWIPDVWSMQYGAWNLESDVCYDQMVIFHTHGADNPVGYALGKAQDYCLPVLHDAYALIPVYNRDELALEDGVHEFWGESLTRFWENIRSSDGALGGAVMAAVDEDGSFHPSLKGFCYGVLDSNHRPKPEYWHLKMTYQEDPFTIKKQDCQWVISNSRIRCLLNTQTGLLSGLWIGGRQAVCEGPFLQTGRFRLGPWQLSSINEEFIAKGIRLTIRGCYETCSVTFILTLTEYGALSTSCRLDHISRPMPHQVKAGIGLDPGGLDEFGIRYLLPADMNTLEWTRHALWPNYPDDHIGRPRGRADRSSRSDFTSRKANVKDACISSGQCSIRLDPLPGQSLRLALSADPRCVLDDRDSSSELAQVSWNGNWFAVEDAAGLVNSTETMACEADASCHIRFYGTGLVVYGTTDRIRGCCDIQIDGTPAASQISQHTPTAQVPGMSRGYEKRYHQVLFCTDSLPLGWHECLITVTGTKESASQGTWISVDSFEVMNPDCPRQVSLIVCQDYNYPRLTQGNYMRPAVMIQDGDEAVCRLFFEEKGGKSL